MFYGSDIWRPQPKKDYDILVVVASVIAVIVVGVSDNWQAIVRLLGG